MERMIIPINKEIQSPDSYSGEEKFMDFLDKAKIRITYWMSHSDHHLNEYITFAEQLAEEGKTAASRHIEEVVSLTMRMNDTMKKALQELD